MDVEDEEPVGMVELEFDIGIRWMLIVYPTTLALIAISVVVYLGLER